MRGIERVNDSRNKGYSGNDEHDRAPKNNRFFVLYHNSIVDDNTEKKRKEKFGYKFDKG